MKRIIVYFNTLLIICLSSCKEVDKMALAEKFFRQGENGKAIDMLEKILSEDREKCDALHLLGEVYMLVDERKAVEYYVQAINCDSMFISYHFQEADSAFLAWDSNRAYLNLNIVLLRNFPDVPGVKFRMARYYILLEQNSRSELSRSLIFDELRAMKDTVPFYGDMLVILGRSFLMDEMYPEAMEYFRKAHGYYDSAEVFYWVGRTYFYQENWDKAIENYSLSIAIDSLDCETYYGRSKAYAESGQKELACLDYAKVVYLDSAYAKGRSDIPCN